MTLDLRLPMGLMFTLLGLLLLGYGLFGNAAVYQVSLGVNVNLWSGLAMLAFGVLMLTGALRAGRR